MTAPTAADLRHFETFGFVVLRGALAEELPWIEVEFERVFRDQGIVHDGSRRSCVIPFTEHSLRLQCLIDHPVVDAVFSAALGPDWSWFGGDGDLYTGDTGWHADGLRRLVRFVKLAVYLDPLTASTGALRVIPGSHRLAPDGTAFGDDARQAARSEELWGVTGQDVPSVALECRPGDLVAFDQNLLHGSWGGGPRRRMFTLNACQRVRTAEARAELRDVIEHHANFWMEAIHSPAFVASSPPHRRRRLEQVVALSDRLPSLAAEARACMDRPAWQTPVRTGM